MWKFTPSPGWDLLIFGWIFPSPRNWIKIPKEIGFYDHLLGIRMDESKVEGFSDLDEFAPKTLNDFLVGG